MDEKNLEGCENLRQHGEGLVSNRRGQWRYRIGGYRLLAEINEKFFYVKQYDIMDAMVLAFAD
ncbi:hypothetical protein LBYZC6_38740 [Lacrimispora brassicae]